MLVDRVVVATPEIEESYCHTASYTCAVAAGRALLGEDVARLADAVAAELAAPALEVSRTSGSRSSVRAGTGRPCSRRR